MEDYEYVETLERMIDGYQRDFAKITAIIAGVNVFYGLGEAWQKVEFLPSVQEAWCIALGWDGTSGPPVPAYVYNRELAHQAEDITK